MSSPVEITPELMAGFLDEAPEYLDMLDAGLMEFESVAGANGVSLESPEDRERMNEMFRAAHSLKGLAAAFGFEKIKSLTHQMETLFDQVRMGQKTLTAESIEALFKVFDRLKALVNELTDESGRTVEIDDMLELLQGILDAAGPGVPSAAAPNDPETAEGEKAPGVTLLQDLGAFQDPELASIFIETTTEAIDELNHGLLGLENTPDDSDLINRIFRSAHNIKGASGAAGLDGVNRVTHNMETVFDHLRNGRLQLEDDLVGALFEAVDRLKAVIDQIRNGQYEDVGPDEMVDHFERWMEPRPVEAAATVAGSDLPAPCGAGVSSGHAVLTDTAFSDGELSGAGPADVGPADVGPADVGPADVAPARPGDAGFSGLDDSIELTVQFRDTFDEAPIQAYLIYNRLSGLGEVLETHPDIDDLTGESAVTSVRFRVSTPAPAHEIVAAVKAFEVVSVEVTGGLSSETHEAGAESSTEQAAASDSNTTAAVAPLNAEAERLAASLVGASSPTAVAVPSGSPSTKPSNGPSGASRAVASTGSSSPSGAGVAKAAPPPSAQGAGGPVRKPAGKVVKSGETLRVDQERLDQLMNLGGELVINKARFVQIHGKFRDLFDNKNHTFLVDDVLERLDELQQGMSAVRQGRRTLAELDGLESHFRHISSGMDAIRGVVQRAHDARLALHDFDEALHGLNRVSEGLQKGIMGTRMVPIGPLFTRFRRVIRDIAKGCGKHVNLELRGEQTELDKRMIDELGDPLTHMVRNAVDHGIEIPEQRRAAGKVETGTVILEACHRGNSICIEVSDDGGGINVARVREKILEKELATEAQVERMSDRELIQFVLKPGFSTAQQVTDLSGRGMGMDIVVAKLEQLNGTIEIDSTQGVGTKITIRLPLTLAILTSMVARIGGGIYAIPLESVAEIITVRRSDVQRIQRRQVVCVRERVVPLAHFEEVFGTSADGLQTRSREADDKTLVIVGVDNEQLGLVVDELLGQEDVVIKSIAENYKNVRGFAGASIRGDGTVSLILDIAAMIEMAGEAAAAAAEVAS